ncbi:hypothetical protein [Pontibacter sp. SGAir0037]|uniref:hypothetical protein n=1 Tax=Pontibacter sp. SGAir0037 TaxID=2571030 RepID=UPI0010CD25CA|nr:hypothetical protein [Pontibacter sp. SGAir0037]QCR23357.1 hypothetical protein C1N53_14090 [Pontibacter sp. SGAir0037]
MTDKNRYIVTVQDGQQVDLTQAKVVKSNNLYPFGQHNYAIYETPEGYFIKGLNTGAREIMLTCYELINEEEAYTYKHPYIREDEF